MSLNVLVELLKKKGCRASDVARDTGISNGLLGDYAHGRKKPSAKNLRLLAEYFGVSEAYLLRRFWDVDGNGDEPVIEPFESSSVMDRAVLSNITRLLREQSKSQCDLADTLGISPQIVSDWKRGRNRSYLRHLPAISEFFEVPVDELTRVLPEEPREDAGTVPTSIPLPARPALTEAEEELLRVFRALSPRSRHELMTQAYTLEDGEASSGETTGQNHSA